MPWAARLHSPPSGPQWEPFFNVVLSLVSKYRRLRGFHNKNSVFHSSGGWESEIKVMAGLFPSEASLLGL